MNCVVCNTKMIDEENVMCAKENIKLFDKPHNIEYGAVTLYRCPCCTHLQINNVISNDIYEEEYNVDYASWTSVVESDKKYLEKLQTLSQGECVCEIGCGEGRTLEVATSFFDRVIGIEPAKKQALMAQEKIGKKGVVKNEFFSADTNLEKKVDAFYSKMVFEHLENPKSVLERMFDCLKPGGVGWINVPNGQRIFDQNLYHLFSFVHLQYYTPFSLSLLAHKIGFEIIEIDSHEDNSEIIDIDIILRKPNANRGKFQEQKDYLKDELKRNIGETDVVTIWGAGIKAHKYIELLDESIHIAHIVDKSESKIGKYISHLNLPIEKISGDIIYSSDVVLIFASMYNDEIICELKDKNFDGKILYFEKGELMLN